MGLITNRLEISGELSFIPPEILRKPMVSDDFRGNRG